MKNSLSIGLFRKILAAVGVSLACLVTTLAFAVPAQPVAIAPIGEVDTGSPDFVWQDQADATQYRVYVFDRQARQRVHLQDYNSTDVCVDGECRLQLDLQLGFSKNHRFYLKAKNSEGYSDWTRNFFDYGVAASAIVTGLVPPNSSAEAVPAFQWSEASGATSYRLFVRNRVDKVTTVLQDYVATEICDNGSCTVGAADAGLPVGDDLLFRVRAYNSGGGWNSWSAPSYFSYTPPAVVTGLIAPENSSAIASAFQWSAVSGATAYRLLVRNEDDNKRVLLKKYTNTDICDGVTCSVNTADLGLPQGKELIFRVRASNSVGWNAWSAFSNFTLVPEATPRGFNVTHRSGQTFLTWDETSPTDGYHIYRSSSLITEANLSSANKLTNRWGPLDQDTSVNTHVGHAELPANFVIADLAPPLLDDQGLFVYTTKAEDSGTAYYAVTSVVGGTEDTTTIQVSTQVTESVALPTDVLTVSVNDGKGRLYTQYMDYSNWNPTFNGYAYNYSVALPNNYNPAQSYPLLIEPHAFGEEPKFRTASEYDWQVIQLFPYDPGADVGSIHSWWYGYAADHNYLTEGDVPNSGRIANFTEQRVMRSVDTIIANSAFNIDEKRIHAYGNSMGASGVLSWGMRYPSLLAGIYASQPMTNYKTSPTFSYELENLWGLKTDNLPIVNGGPHIEDISIYGEDGVQTIGVWDWTNHHKQLVERRGDEFAYLMISHGKADGTIDWLTQGKPMVQALTTANAGFSAVANGNSHIWAGFDAVVRNMFGFGYDDEFTWKYPLDLSFPAIQNASGSGDIVPGNNSNITDTHNLDFEWATAHNPFDTGIVDLADTYEITIKSTGAVQTADITPRRTQEFNRNANDQCAWTATDRDTGNSVGAGSVVADADSLVTVQGVTVVGGTGTRLVIDCQ